MAQKSLRKTLLSLSIAAVIGCTASGSVFADGDNVEALESRITELEALVHKRLQNQQAPAAPAAKVDTAAIEQVFVNRNRNTAMAVARASGVIMATLALRGIEVSEYTPSQMKMAVTGSGAADKAQISAVVAMRLGLRELAGPADVADAAGIALCHTQHSGVLSAEVVR